MVQSAAAVRRTETVAREGPAAAWITRLETPLHTSETGPLAGLTFAVKDNIDVEGVPTTAGCPAFAYTAQRHATVVRKLLDAGARVAGKTNLDQFACGLNGTRSPYGAVPNAFDARYVSGGSSSGSAYAVAAGEVDFALGTDTAGSGRVPAGLNNIVGLKPSKGLISAYGVVPAAQSVDCVSIFARSVGLAAQVLAQALGPDPYDPYSRTLTLKAAPLPARFAFGVPDQLEFFGDELARAAFGQAIARIKEMGGTPVTIDYAPLSKAADLLYGSALVAERYAAVRGFFDGREADIIEPVRSILAAGCGYSAAEWCDAQLRLHDCGQVAAQMWEQIDLLLVPTAPTHYTIAAMKADPVVLNRNLGAYTNFVNLLDYAALSVPSSIRPDGLPFGITLIGPCGSDWQLAELGQRYHHATGLMQGATGLALPAPLDIFALCPSPQPFPRGGEGARPNVRVAVVGAHLSGMPLNGQLTERGACLVATTETAPDYRFFALPGTVPPKPGLLRVAPGTGTRIAVEVWEMPAEHYGSFVALIPAPLGIGSLALTDGSAVQGFVCEALATEGAQDISHHGGWRAYLAARNASTSSIS
jgi:allophanate hydrolase